MDIQACLARCAVFADLDAAALDRVVSRFHPVRFEESDTICREGDRGDRMFVLVSGEVSVVKNMGWGRRELKRMGPGEVFGEMALISREKRSATVQAVIPVECLQMDGGDFSALLEEDPRIAQQVLRVLTDRLQGSDERAAADLVNSQRAIIFALAALADSRDPETGAHLERTRNYCALLAELLSRDPRYAARVDSAFIESLYYLSPLHDIGKVSIPDSILLKPGRLTPEEFEVMKLHASSGAETLRRAIEECDQEAFHRAYRICLYHHEKWDGTGYPEGLKGEDIPLEARIMALADVYDALLSRRVYKPPMSYAAVNAEMAKCSGTAFDPVLADLMLAHIGEFEKIHQKYQDERNDPLFLNS